jgi:hypothetical protein
MKIKMKTEDTVGAFLGILIIIFIFVIWISGAQW